MLLRAPEYSHPASHNSPGTFRLEGLEGSPLPPHHLIPFDPHSTIAIVRRSKAPHIILARSISCALPREQYTGPTVSCVQNTSSIGHCSYRASSHFYRYGRSVSHDCATTLNQHLCTPRAPIYLIGLPALSLTLFKSQSFIVRCWPVLTFFHRRLTSSVAQFLDFLSLPNSILHVHTILNLCTALVASTSSFCFCL